MGILVHSNGMPGLSFSVPGAMFTYALGIDNRGSVIGRWSSPSQDIFVRSPNGTLSYLALPSGVTVLTEAAISENGRIVVSANDSMYFLDGQTYAAVAVPGAGGAGNAVNVGGINNSGDVVGYYYTNSGTSPSFFRDLKGAFETIDVPGSAYTNVMGPQRPRPGCRFLLRWGAIPWLSLDCRDHYSARLSRSGRDVCERNQRRR